MQHDTGQWLEPMVGAASADDIQELLRQATMPMQETYHPLRDLQAELPDVQLKAIDWVHFGYLLRSRLGWDGTYPEHPRTQLV